MEEPYNIPSALVRLIRYGKAFLAELEALAAPFSDPPAEGRPGVPFGQDLALIMFLAVLYRARIEAMRHPEVRRLAEDLTFEVIIRGHGLLQEPPRVDTPLRALMKHLHDDDRIFALHMGLSRCAILGGMYERRNDLEALAITGLLKVLSGPDPLFLKEIAYHLMLSEVLRLDVDAPPEDTALPVSERAERACERRHDIIEAAHAAILAEAQGAANALRLCVSTGDRALLLPPEAVGLWAPPPGTAPVEPPADAVPHTPPEGS